MTRECLCSDADRAALASPECCCRLSRRHEDSHLREENLWLVQQLAISEANTQRWQERAQALRRQVRTMEQQLMTERAQWQRTMSQKERAWTREYDDHMQSLLQIIGHHEETQCRLQDDIQALRTRAETTSCSTQTDQIEKADAAVQQEHAGADHVCVSMDEPERKVDEAEAAPPTPSDSIHEQYVALTMQKLLEQLRQSNLQTLQRPPCEVSSTILQPEIVLSFRDSIRQRLIGSANEPDTQLPSKSIQRLSAATKLPVLYEQEALADVGTSITERMRSKAREKSRHPPAA